MSFNDLCECVYPFIQRQMREVNGIMESNSGHTVYTDRGFSSAEEAFGLPRARGGEISSTTIVTAVFVVLMVSVLLLMSSRRPASTEKPRGSRGGGGADEKKRPPDRPFLQ